MLDLHFHSYYSDGVYSPKELAQEAKRLGFKIVSLTDHNGIAGIEEMNAECKMAGIRNIPGVEIYTHYKNFHLHLLGYNFDVRNKELNKVLDRLQKGKIPIIEDCLKILKEDGWEIDVDRVFSSPSVYIGINQPAKELMVGGKNWQRIKKDFNLQKEDILTITEVVAKYFFKNHKSICPETEIDTVEAIKLIHQAGGRAVLAHPGQQLSWKDDYIVEELKSKGLDGLEAISSHYGWDGIEHWQKLARKLKLFITAGSDFHGYVPQEWRFAVRGPWDYFKVSNKKLIDTNLKRILEK